jgi:hypothetical protein
MEKQEKGDLDSLKPGDKVWLNGERVTLVYIIPAHQWPHEHDNKIDQAVRTHMSPPKTNPPQQSRESIEYWRKWREDQYVVCYPPNDYWVSTTRRVKLSELSLTPPLEEKDTAKKWRKKTTKKI